MKDAALWFVVISIKEEDCGQEGSEDTEMKEEGPDNDDLLGLVKIWDVCSRL